MGEISLVHKKSGLCFGAAELSARTRDLRIAESVIIQNSLRKATPTSFGSRSSHRRHPSAPVAASSQSPNKRPGTVPLCNILLSLTPEGVRIRVQAFINKFPKGGPIIENVRLYKILMVCTGNICRSPMAAGLLNHLLPGDLKGRIEVSSAGTHALHGHQAHEYAVAAMARLGIDISGHRARLITRDLIRGTDLILVMEATQAEIVKKVSGRGRSKPRMISEFDPETTVSDIEDPYGAPLEAFQDCIQTLQPCIKGVLLWLRSNIQ
jgi:protein-tyrosine phosphatase